MEKSKRKRISGADGVGEEHIMFARNNVPPAALDELNESEPIHGKLKPH